jgi:hypothetical protein
MAKKQQEEIKQPQEAEQPQPGIHIGQIGDYKPIPKFSKKCPNC